jgi:hypothetical protein
LKHKATVADNQPDDQLHIPVRDDNKPYTIEDLYPDQKRIMFRVLKKIKEWLACEDMSNFKPLYLTIDGPGGSGKSVVINTIVAVLRRMFQCNGVVSVAAPSGNAAFNVNGTTMHTLVSMALNDKGTITDVKKIKKLSERFKVMLCLIVDERSLIGTRDFGCMEKRIKQVIHQKTGNQEQMFGGLPVVIVAGDDYQLPSMSSIINSFQKTKMLELEGRGVLALLECARCVVQLKTSRRLADSQAHQKVLLGKTRLGGLDMTQIEINKLMSLHLDNHGRVFGEKAVQVIRKKAVYLFYTNDKKNAHNMQMLHEVSSETNPVAFITPHSFGLRKFGKGIASHYNTNSKNAARTCLLCVGAVVTIDGRNFNPTWGLYNGARGTVDEVIFARGENPNTGNLPTHVVVHFPAYKGPPWDLANPKDIPIPLIDTRCETMKCPCYRTHVPLTLAWASTVHKFQGQSAGPVDEGKIPNTCDVVICDPHDKKAETTALGLFYTILSRATTLGNTEGLGSAVYFIGPSLNQERVTNIGQLKNSLDFSKPFQKRHAWVNHLMLGLDENNLEDHEQLQLQNWSDSIQLGEKELTQLILSRAN